MKKFAHIVIFGSVQGVFYRAEAKRKAEELDLTGYVRNMSNGGVEILTEGEEEKLKEFIKWRYDGSNNAIVDEIKLEWAEYKGKFDKFEIIV